MSDNMNGIDEVIVKMIMIKYNYTNIDNDNDNDNGYNMQINRSHHIYSYFNRFMIFDK